MGRPQRIDHDKVKRAILEFLSPQKTAGMFLGFPTIRVHQYIVKFWKIRCSQKVVFNNLLELKEKGLVVCKKTRLGHYYWKGIPEVLLKTSIDADVEIAIRKIDKMPVNKETTNEEVEENVKTRRGELRRLGYNIDETEFLFKDPLPQLRVSEIKEYSPDEVLVMYERGFRDITPRNKKKQRLLKELEYIEKGFIVEGNGSGWEHEVYKYWGKMKPQMTMVFRKLFKELEEEEKG